jgi:hypothetical protein
MNQPALHNRAKMHLDRVVLQIPRHSGLRLKLDKAGVSHWDTLAAQLDDAGTPHPVPGAATPCGQRGDTSISECRRP